MKIGGDQMPLQLAKGLVVQTKEFEHHLGGLRDP